MKIAQLHMYINIVYNFQSSTCKTVGEKLQTKLCSRTDGWMDGQTEGWTAMAIPVYSPSLRCGGYNKRNIGDVTSYFVFINVGKISQSNILTNTTAIQYSHFLCES